MTHLISGFSVVGRQCHSPKNAQTRCWRLGADALLSEKSVCGQRNMSTVPRLLLLPLKLGCTGATYVLIRFIFFRIVPYVLLDYCGNGYCDKLLNVTVFWSTLEVPNGNFILQVLC